MLVLPNRQPLHIDYERTEIRTWSVNPTPLSVLIGVILWNWGDLYRINEVIQQILIQHIQLLAFMHLWYKERRNEENYLRYCIFGLVLLHWKRYDTGQFSIWIWLFKFKWFLCDNILNSNSERFRDSLLSIWSRRGCVMFRVLNNRLSSF